MKKADSFDKWLLIGMAGTLAIIAIFATFGFMLKPKPETQADFDRDTVRWSRKVAQEFLIGEQVKCLPEPLSKRQKEYLTHTSVNATQRYLRALDDPACELRAIKVCESVNPGKCIATPEE